MLKQALDRAGRWGMGKLFILGLGGLIAFGAQAQGVINSNATVRISEFMASNKNTLKDEDGDSSDWIEIYNPTATPVNLLGWSLTDKATELMLWQFPDVVLLPDDYMVIFASGKNRTNSTAELHTNFKLDAAGEYLALVDPGTNIVSEFTPAFPPQQTDISFGCDQVSPDYVGYFSVPTPGDANTPMGDTVSAAVQFSQGGGTFLAPFALQLSVTNSTAVIRLTQDGTPPTDASPVYTTALLITNSVQIRARSFTPGLLPGPLHSESYLQLDPSLVQSNSDLPIMVLYNFGAGAVPVDDDQFANVAIYEPTNGASSLANAPTLDVRAGIHLHGSSTLSLPKQSFAVEFWDEYDDDQDYSPLELPAESDWVLYAPGLWDEPLIRNPLIYQLSNDIGRYASRTRWVALYLNTTGGAVSTADYNGLYVLEEKIKRGPNRVNIQKLEEYDNTSPDVTGGYMLKIDRLGPGESGFYAAGETLLYVDPKEEDITTPQRAPQQQYIQAYMNAFGAALVAPNWLDPTNGYRAFVDVPSWIDYHILNVMAMNVDAFVLSTYFYKDRNGKLTFGPIWDFDRSQGSDFGAANPLTWARASTSSYFSDAWWSQMFSDIDFWQQWIDRYEELRTGALSTNHIFAVIDSQVNQIAMEQPRDAARWPEWNTVPYQDRVDALKQWYADRLNFMDTNFLARPVCNQNGGGVPPGFTLFLSSPDGATVYYTTNGSDPRLPGGGISSSAQVCSAAIMLETNATILARAYDTNHFNLTAADDGPPLSSPWSGLTTAVFQTVTAPYIIQRPGDLFAYIGQTPTFTVQAIGSPAPAYQWQFNGTDLLSQTTTQLSLSAVQLSQSGAYSVVVSNSAGSTNLPFTLTVTTKPRLVVTEAMSSEAKNGQGSTLDHEDWWELSNLDTFAVNLRGFRLDDNSASLAYAFTFTNEVTIQPGESIVFVEDMSADAFRTWWGPAALPPDLKIITYSGSGLGFDNAGDAINLWNAVATADTDKVASVALGTATRGVSFGFNPDTGTFGGLSVAGMNGAFVAAVNGDIGSPGTIVNLPRFTIVSAANGQFSLSLFTQPQRNYRIEYKASLSDPDWLTLTNVTAAPNPLKITDPIPRAQSCRFYRAIMVP